MTRQALALFLLASDTLVATGSNLDLLWWTRWVHKVHWRVKAILGVALSLAFFSSTAALSADFPICGSGPRITCVVDGDTVWVNRAKYRLEGIDTPEKGALAKCMQEGLQAIEATKRLAEILSMHQFAIEATGMDRYGRVLAHFHIGHTTAGQMLVAEGLARPWRGHREKWCD
jgi:micrococcal nuclease